MSERLTPDRLVQMIEQSPDNPAAHGVPVMRSGKRLEIGGFVDVEKLTAKINNWVEEASCRT